MDLVTYMETSPYRPLPWDARVVPLDFPVQTHDPIDSYVPHDSYEPFHNVKEEQPKTTTYATVLAATTASSVHTGHTNQPAKVQKREKQKARVIVSRPALKPSPREPKPMLEVEHDKPTDVPVSPLPVSPVNTQMELDWADL